MCGGWSSSFDYPLGILITRASPGDNLYLPVLPIAPVKMVFLLVYGPQATRGSAGNVTSTSKDPYHFLLPIMMCFFGEGTSHFEPL